MQVPPCAALLRRTRPRCRDLAGGNEYMVLQCRSVGSNSLVATTASRTLLKVRCTCGVHLSLEVNVAPVLLLAVSTEDRWQDPGYA